MSSIYICYRRDDTRVVAARLADALAHALGPERVRVDRDDLVPGEDLNDYMQRQVRETAVMLVLIGPRWLALADATGTRHIDQPTDLVRFEIATALQAGLRVVPVLTDDAQFPLADDVPGDLQPLLRRQGMALTTERWPQDLARLLEVLRPLLGASGRADEGPLASIKRWFAPQPSRTAAPPSPPSRLPPAPSQSQARAADAPSPAPGREPAWEVFISYAFEDEVWAQRVVGALEGQGFACFVASRDIVPGSPSYARDVVRAIKGSRLLVVLLSAASNGSDDVLSEITLAKNHKVPRLALRLDEAQMDDGFDYFFAQAQRLEAAQLDVDEALRRLSAAVLRQIGPAQPG